MHRFLLIAFLFSFATIAYAEVRIGVLAPQGAEIAEERWSPLLERLATEIGEPVGLFPVNAQDGVEDLYRGSIDFLIGNPVQTAVVVDTFRAEALASVQRGANTQFAGVIIAKAGSEIRSVDDLAGRRIATLGDWAAGGYLFQSDHLIESGLGTVSKVATRLRGENQNELVEMVRSGRADAAFIRTGVLEDLIGKGVISADEIIVVDEQMGGDLRRSTKWFPEWFVVARQSVDPEARQRVKEALMALSENDVEMQTARVTAFIAPLDVSPVVNAMKRVGVAPYQ